ncbi:MAG: carboxylesterase family protein, partial [Bacteroidetes bacterium]|nr:carboxylesterase family protein [Bacteroidota bacterium]
YARKLSGIKVIIGTNEDEGAAFIGKKDIGLPVFEPLFRSNAPMADAYYHGLLRTDSPYAAMVRTLTQYMYQLHSYRLAGALSGGGVPVYVYRYAFSNGREFGARHGDELRYIWDPRSGDDPVKAGLARGLHSAWAAFIRTGDPNGQAIPQWPVYRVGDPRVMVFDGEDKVVRLKEVYDDRKFPSAVFVIK